MKTVEVGFQVAMVLSGDVVPEDMPILVEPEGCKLYREGTAPEPDLLTYLLSGYAQDGSDVDLAIARAEQILSAV